MSLAALIRSMAEAGAPSEAIALAVEAIEAREAEAERPRRLARERKRRQRERDCHAAVTGQERDGDGTKGDTPLDKKGPQTPKELNPPSPTNDADASSVPPGVDGEEGHRQVEAIAKPKAAKPEVPKRQAAKRKPGSRLKADWEPPAVTELPLEVQAHVGQWPAGAYETVAMMFRNHWLAEGRAVGAKRDWPRTWHNWLVRESSTILKAKRNGVAFSAGRVSAASSERPQWFLEAADAVAERQQAECEVAKGIRAVLRREMGEKAYDAWFKPTLIEIRGSTVAFSAPTRFMLDWIESEYGQLIGELAAHQLRSRVSMRWELLRAPDRKAA
jgi:hypothetical protein